MDNWFMQIQSRVFTQVEYMLKKKYPSLICTTRNEKGTFAEFPTLYLHELTAIEQGQDLTNETVNAVLSTIEIQVWCNTTEDDCKKILSDAVNQMKLMQFNIIGMPIVTENDSIAWGVIRCRRLVGSGDKIVN